MFFHHNYLENNYIFVVALFELKMFTRRAFNQINNNNNNKL